MIINCKTSSIRPVMKLPHNTCCISVLKRYDNLSIILGYTLKLIIHEPFSEYYDYLYTMF